MKNAICLLNDSFPPVIDGVANTVVNYADIIERNHTHSLVITPKVRGLKYATHPFPVIKYPSIDTRKIMGYVTGYPFSPDAAHAVQSEGACLLHTHSPFISTLLGIQLAESFDLPLILTWHTKYDIEIAKAIKNKMLQEGAILTLLRLVNACDEVWTVSEGAGENLRSLGYEKDYVVMSNGVDLPHEAVSPEAVKSVTAGYDLPDGVPCFLFIGRMMWYKGLRLILDALSELKRDGIDFRMVFVGGGGDEQEVRAYTGELELNEEVFFTGPIYDRDDLRAWYSRADLFLFPSTYDTNGLVVREAAASDTAAVIIEGSCAAEGIIDGRNGFLIREDAASLAAELKELAANPAIMHEVGIRAGREIYISWEDAVATAFDRYGEVADRYRKGEYPKRDAISTVLLRSRGDLMQVLGDIGAAGKEFRNDLDMVRKDALDRIEGIWDKLDRYL